MIELIDIHKSFGTVQALRGVSLTAAPGTIHGVVGENGAGKSTLMKILTGFISKTSGDIRMADRPLTLTSPGEAKELGIGMLYQEPLDFPQLSVIDNFLAGHQSYDLAQGKKVLADLSAEFGFSFQPDKPAEELTVGERQQLELLRLIRDGVKVLILDEPTTGISEIQQQQLFHALRKLQGDGATIFLVSHKLEEVDSLCDTVSVLRNGALVASQTAPFDRGELLTAMFGQLPDDQTHRPNVAAADDNVILEFSQVTINIGRSGLHEASATIHRGEIVGLAGIDGSGQAVFLKACFGLYAPERGTIARFGSPLRNLYAASQRGRAVFLPADRLSEGLFPALSVRDHHLLARQHESFFLTARSHLKETKNAIHTFNIKGEPQTPAADLSGGNQQRLLLSLIPNNAELILLENPTRGLDIHSTSWTWKFLREKAANGATIVFASPDLEEIMAETNRVMVFFNGKIALDKPTATVTFPVVSGAITGEHRPDRY